MTTEEAACRFLQDLANDGRSPHTVAAYRRDLTAFTEFAGRRDITSITPADLTAFMATDRVQVRPCGAPRAKATINRYRVSLKALFAWCEARWLVPRNPTAILKCRRHRSLPPLVLTERDITLLMETSFRGRQAGRDQALISFMLGTGCRLAETVALNVEDIDWTTGTVTLHNAKGGDPEQVITSERVCNKLRPLAGGTAPTDPLFRTGPGRRLSTRQVQRIVASRCLEAGITTPVTPHTLRHTFATRLYNQTADIRLVQQALRHEFVTTTQRYTQIDVARWKQALEASA